MGGARRIADPARVGDARAEGRRRTGGEGPRALTGARAVLALQRSAGNRAVVAHLRTHTSATPLPIRPPTRAAARSPLPVQRGLLGFLGDAASGAWSWAKDLGRGAKRTARGLKFWDDDAMLKIAAENESAWRLFKRLVKGGVRGALLVVSNLMEIAVGVFTTWAYLPQELKSLALQKLGAAARGVVEKVAAKAVGKWAVKRVVRKLAERVVKSGAYRLLAKKLGVSAAFSGTGVGIPVAMLGIQGLIEKAASASDRLRSTLPGLHRQLMRADLHMAWFLVAPFVGRLREMLAARLATMLNRSRDGRVLIDSGHGDGRTPIRAGGGDDRVPIRTGGSPRDRRVPIRTGGG